MLTHFIIVSFNILKSRMMYLRKRLHNTYAQCKFVEVNSHVKCLSMLPMLSPTILNERSLQAFQRPLAQFCDRKPLLPAENHCLSCRLCFISCKTSLTLLSFAYSQACVYLQSHGMFVPFVFSVCTTVSEIYQALWHSSLFTFTVEWSS